MLQLIVFLSHVVQLKLLVLCSAGLRFVIGGAGRARVEEEFNAHVRGWTSVGGVGVDAFEVEELLFGFGKSGYHMLQPQAKAAQPIDHISLGHIVALAQLVGNPDYQHH